MHPQVRASHQRLVEMPRCLRADVRNFNAAAVRLAHRCSCTGASSLLAPAASWLHATQHLHLTCAADSCSSGKLMVASWRPEQEQ